MGLPLDVQCRRNPALAARIVAEPALAAKRFFGIDLHPAQEALVRSVFGPERVIVATSGHATGKSYSLAVIASLWLLGRPGSTVVILAQDLDNLRIRVFGAMRRLVTQAGAQPERWRFTAGVQARSWVLAPEWQAVGRSIQGDETGGQGWHSDAGTLVIVEEASALEDGMRRTINGVLTGWRDRLLLIGNPLRSAGPFARDIEMAEAGQGGRRLIRMASVESPNAVWAWAAEALAAGECEAGDVAGLAAAVRARWPESARAAVSEDRLLPQVIWTWDRVRGWAPDGDWLGAFRARPEVLPGLCSAVKIQDWADEYRADSDEFGARVLGLLPYLGDDELFSRRMFAAAAERDWTRRGGRVVLGADVGASHDSTAFIVRDDWSVIHAERIPPGRIDKSNYRATIKGRLRELFAEFAVDEGYVDDTGIGHGIAAELRAEGLTTCFDLLPGGRADDGKRFANMRAESAFRAKAWLEGGGAMPPEAAARLKERAGIKWKADKTGRYVLEAKVDFKDRNGGESPDELDAFCYSFGALPGRRMFADGGEVVAVARENVDAAPWTVWREHGTAGRSTIVLGPGVGLGDEPGALWRAAKWHPAGPSGLVWGHRSPGGMWSVLGHSIIPGPSTLGDFVGRLWDSYPRGAEGEVLPFAVDWIAFSGADDEFSGASGDGTIGTRTAWEFFRLWGARSNAAREDRGCPAEFDTRRLSGVAGVAAMEGLIRSGLARDRMHPMWAGRAEEWASALQAEWMEIRDPAVARAVEAARYEPEAATADQGADARLRAVGGGGVLVACLRMALVATGVGEAVPVDPVPFIPRRLSVSGAKWGR